MAKRVQVSADDTTYYTLPGNTAELRNEAGELVDTIFGQEYASGETGLITWQLNANAIFKGFAGYVVSLKKTGISTLMTAEPASLVSGKIYQIVAATKHIIDPETAVTVLDNAVDKTAEVIRIDYLRGIVEFDAGYTVTGPVTITAHYLPTSDIAGAKAFTLSQQAEAIDETDIPTAKANDGFSIFAAGLKTVSLELSGIYKAANGFIEALKAREIIVVEINPDNGGLAVARGFFKYMNQSQTGDVGALEEETINLQLSVPDVELMDTPFTWYFSNLSTINPGVKLLLQAWLAGDPVYVRYLPDGVNGFEGSAVVTDISLSGGLEAMNEFTANFQGSGEPTEYP